MDDRDRAVGVMDQPVLTDPSRIRSIALRPWLPTTNISASLDTSTRVGTGSPVINSPLTSSGPNCFVLSSTVLSASVRTLRPSSFSHCL